MTTMPMRLSCEYQFRPKQPTCNTSYIQTVFGIGFETGRNVIASGIELEYAPGRIVLFLGPSGSGKSSLLRAAAGQAPDAALLDEAPMDERAMIETLGDDVRAAAHLLSLCGLAEAFLMLRSPRELSDGQRYRYALARCAASGAATIIADEWCATLDRVTAKVVSRNARKIADKRRVGILAATTHEDVAADLCPDVIVRCSGRGAVHVENRPAERPPISFLDELAITDGRVADWERFSQWHYRRGGLGPTRRVHMLVHGDEPVGICLVGPGPLGSSVRNRHFGVKVVRGKGYAAMINRNFAAVTRLVIDPRYRGAGLAARFLRRVAQMTPRPWIELVSEMADLVPFCESAGFRRIGRTPDRSGKSLSAMMSQAASGRIGHCSGAKRPATLAAYFRRGRFTRPVHYLFDNRASFRRAPNGSRDSGPIRVPLSEDDFSSCNTGSGTGY